MKKKITTLLLTLVLCLGLLPSAALAAGIPSIGWHYQIPEDPGAITYNMEIADFGSVEYGFTEKDCPSLTITFTNNSGQSLWYIDENGAKGDNRFAPPTVHSEGWGEVQSYRHGPGRAYARELKPGASASLTLTLRTSPYMGGTGFPAGVYEGDLDFFFAESTEPVGSNHYGPYFKGGNYPLPYRFEVVYDGYMGGGDVMELDRESVEFGLVEIDKATTETLTVTNRAQVELTLNARLSSQCLYHGDNETKMGHRMALTESQWTLAPGETAQVQIVAKDFLRWFLGRYDTELVLSSRYLVEGGGNRKEHRDEKVVPISLTLVENGSLPVTVELVNPHGPSGYFTYADGATTYWGNDGIPVPYGGDLSLKIIPFDPQHGYILAVQGYEDKDTPYYMGYGDTLQVEDVTDARRFTVSIASCDVPPADWAREAVGRAYSLRLFQPTDIPYRTVGGSSGSGPDAGMPNSSYASPITRKDFCSLAMKLYKNLRPEEYLDIPNVSGGQLPRFADVEEWQDYIPQLAYLGVITGVGNGKFDPDGQLTREQAATILSRLAGVLGIKLEEAEPTFGDNGAISSWATDAVGEMQASGIMGGVGDNQFSPQGTYSWEQSIATLMRLYDRTI